MRNPNQLYTAYRTGYCSAKSLRSFMDKHFLEVCRIHDSCYSIYHMSKEKCDENMKRNLAVICAQSPTLWVCSLIESLVYHAITQGGVEGYRQESGGRGFYQD